MLRLLQISFIVILSTQLSFGQKFAFIDTEYILSQMNEYQSAQKELDDLSEKWQGELAAMMNQITKKQNELKRDEILLPEDTKLLRESEILKLQTDARDFQSKKFGVGGSIFKKRKELIEPIQKKIYKAIKSLANDNNYSFVLEKSKNSNILFADPKYDKSDAVLRKINN
jgi:outer membrane protein